MLPFTPSFFIGLLANSILGTNILIWGVQKFNGFSKDRCCWQEIDKLSQWIWLNMPFHNQPAQLNGRIEKHGGETKDGARGTKLSNPGLRSIILIDVGFLSFVSSSWLITVFLFLDIWLLWHVMFNLHAMAYYSMKLGDSWKFQNGFLPTYRLASAEYSKAGKST